MRSRILNWLRIMRTRCRRWIGWEPTIPACGHAATEYHGHDGGGWCILAESLTPHSVVVDVGLGEDVEFSWSLMRKYQCSVHGFDPTPKSLAYLARNPRAGFVVHPYGVAAAPGPARFFLPVNETHVSGAISRHAHLQSQAISVELITVKSVMERIGASRIDLLKLDIEGAEFDLFASAEFGRVSSSIGQICVEFHHRWPEHGPQRTLQAVRTLAELGFVCAWCSRATNEEFLFVRKEMVPGIPLC